jgi:Effector Associated Constant Component 1
MSNSSIGLSLIGDLPSPRLAQLTRNLERDLSRAGIQTRFVEGTPTPGERGEPITLGVLALALVTGGTFKAAIECFKAYLARERRLTIKLTGSNGTQVEVTALNVDSPAVREMFELAASARPG